MTKDAADTELLEVENIIFTSTHDVESNTLMESNILFPNVHGCDRSYEHTEYGSCALHAQTMSLTTQPFSAVRTWKVENGTEYVRFCNMRERDGVTGFLAPYTPSKQTLLLAPQQIRRCTEFNICPTVNFHVRGIQVYRRRVHTVIKTTSNDITESIAVRDFCTLDAQRCFAIGSLVCPSSTDCSCAETVESKICAFDYLVLPMLSVLRELSGDGQRFRSLQEIREFCPYAFSNRLDTWGKDDELYETFQSKFLGVADTILWYNYDDTRLRDTLLFLSNALFFSMFGITEDPQTRGFDSLEKYLNQAKCVAHIARRLHDNEEYHTQQQQPTNPDRKIYYMSSEESVDVIPGGSLYLFVQRQAVFVPLRWLAQCVVLANHQEGGVYDNWVRSLLFGTLDQNQHTDCLNYAYKGSTNQVSLKRRLQTARFLFTQKESQDFYHHEFVADLRSVVSTAIDSLSARSTPEVFCVQAVGAKVIKTFEDAYPNDPMTYTNTTLKRHTLQDPQLDFTGVGIEYEISASGVLNIFHSVEQYLLDGHGTDFNDFSIDKMLELNILHPRADNFESCFQSETACYVDEQKSAYPLYQFTKLENMQTVNEELLPEVATSMNYVQTGKEGCCPSDQDCTMWFRLQTPEYALPPLVCTKCVEVVDEVRDGQPVRMHVY